MFLKSFPDRDETGNGLALCRQGPRSNLVHDALCTLKSHETYSDNSLASRYSPVELVYRLLNPLGFVALKMGGRLRCSSVRYRSGYAPSYCQSGSDRLAGGPF